MKRVFILMGSFLILAQWDYLGFDLRERQSDLITIGWNHQATKLISFQVNLIGQFDNGGDKYYGATGVMQFQF